MTHWRMVLLLILLTGPRPAAQGIPGVTPDTRPRTPATVPAADREALRPCPPEHHHVFELAADGGSVAVDMFQFPSANHGFSAFTLLRRPGARSFGGREDCFLQDRELVIWRGTQVARADFGGAPRISLSNLVNVLERRLPWDGPPPAIYLALPWGGREEHGRLYLLDIRMLTPNGGVQPPPADPDGLYGPLAVASYRLPGGTFRGGWLAQPPGRPQPPADIESHWAILPTGESPWRVFIDRSAAGEDGVELVARLSDAWQFNRPGGSRFFRRPEVSFFDLIRGAAQMVGIGLAVSGVLAALSIWVISRARRAMGLRSGLERRTVCHLDLAIRRPPASDAPPGPAPPKPGR